MTAIEILTAIGGTKSLSTLDGFARAIWADWGAGRPTDEQASALAETLEGRKREVRGVDTVANRAPHVAVLAKGQGRLSHFPPKQKAARSPVRRASIERRRTLAASGPMPPELASQFTTGELAALRIVADAVRDRGFCILTLGEIAARAGVCDTRLGMRCARPRAMGSSPSRSGGATSVQISPMWCGWFRGNGRRGSSAAPNERCKDAPAVAEGGGCKKTGATDKNSCKILRGDRVSRGQLSQNVLRKTPNSVLRRT